MEPIVIEEGKESQLPLDPVSPPPPTRCNRFVSWITSRLVIGYLLLTVAYILYFPGILKPLYEFHSTKKASMRTEKSIVGTIQALWDKGDHTPAILIGFFGMAVPAMKLLFILIGQACKLPWMKRAVAVVSKWAIVDAIVASVLMVYFDGATDGRVAATLMSGFSYFVLYSLLSTAAAIFIDTNDQWEAYKPAFPRARFLHSRAIGLAVLATGLGLSIAGMCLPTLTTLGVKQDKTVYSINLPLVGTDSILSRLLDADHMNVRPFILLLVFVVIVPIADTLMMAGLFLFPRDNKHVRLALRAVNEFALLDVYVIAVIVMYTFIKTIPQAKLTFPVAGVIVLIAGLAATKFGRYMVNRYLRLRAVAVARESAVSVKLGSPTVMSDARMLDKDTLREFSSSSYSERQGQVAEAV